MRASSSINETLKEYCTSTAVEDRQDKDWARVLHAWNKRMNVAFGLDSATPVNLITRIRQSKSSVIGKLTASGDGLPQAITIGSDGTLCFRYSNVAKINRIYVSQRTRELPP